MHGLERPQTVLSCCSPKAELHASSLQPPELIDNNFSQRACHEVNHPVFASLRWMQLHISAFICVQCHEGHKLTDGKGSADASFSYGSGSEVPVDLLPAAPQNVWTMPRSAIFVSCVDSNTQGPDSLSWQCLRIDFVH